MKQLKLPFCWTFTIPVEHLIAINCNFNYTVPSGSPLTQTTTKDHPSFAELRDTLGELGLISINRNSVNSDVVLEKFTVNNYVFNPKDNFPSAEVVGVWISKMNE